MLIGIYEYKNVCFKYYKSMTYALDIVLVLLLCNRRREEMEEGGGAILMKDYEGMWIK